MLAVSFIDRLHIYMLTRIAEAAIGYGLVYFFDGPTWASIMTAFLVIQMPIITFTPETEPPSPSEESYKTSAVDTPTPSITASVHMYLEDRLRDGLAAIVGRPFPSTFIDFSIVIVSLFALLFWILYVFAAK
jgi:hypothetical protein